MTAKAHADAVKVLIGNAVRLYDGNVPDHPTLPYAVLYMGTGLPETVTCAPDMRGQEFQITSVGLDPEGARSVAERVRSAVLNQRPTVAGRVTSRVVQDVAEPLRLDRDVTPARFYLVDIYSFRSVPA